jgi:hypothetical protein
MSLDKPQAVVLFDVVKSKLTGETPKIGDVKRVTITRGQASKRASAPSSRRRKGSTAPS